MVFSVNPPMHSAQGQWKGREMKRAAILLVLLAGGLPVLPRAVAQDEQAGKPSQIPLRKLSLSGPRLTGTVSVEEALAARRSVRAFGTQGLNLQQISQLAWAAQGITDASRGYRTAPSAGATYPIKLYFAVKGSLYVYLPAEHSLEKLSGEDIRQALSAAAGNQKAVAEAPCSIIIAGCAQKLAGQFGKNAWKFMLLEAGHIAQNIQLQAVCLGLGSVPVGGFDEKKVAEICKLPAEEEPIYIIPVGYPAAASAVPKAGKEPSKPARTTGERPESLLGPNAKRALLVILGGRFQADELFTTQDVLAAAGIDVAIAGTVPGVIRSTTAEGEVQITLLLNQVSVEDYDAIVFLTGSISRQLLFDPVAMGIVRAALQRGRLVAAMGPAVRMLANAGVLAGVRVTGYPGDRRNLQRQGAIYLGTPVERDGPIVTGRSSASASLFARTVAEALAEPAAVPEVYLPATQPPWVLQRRR